MLLALSLASSVFCSIFSPVVLWAYPGAPPAATKAAMVNPVTTMFFRMSIFLLINGVQIQWCSDSSREGEDQHDEKNQPKSSAWVVAPAAAIRPCRQRSNEEKYQHNQNDCAHFIPP